MAKPVIEIRNLSKQYTIGERASYGNLREEIVKTLTSPFRRLTSHSSQNTHDENKIWALKDVSFEVNEGEVIGIIGRNGAGKSTLLKILSRITEPTEGEVRMRGRVGSLLEVGTGFHPELTGRENIFLNGALLGMSRQEISAKFDEIVAFAEIEKFLDTPVKRYSSGMYVRLAFAVAAHLEPEILVIDEVLAVGDAQFQKKCLGKMGDIAKGGRTVLFVSHNMEAVQRLCNRAILLENGSPIKEGNVVPVIDTYLENMREQVENDNLYNLSRRPGFGTVVRISESGLYNADGMKTSKIRFGESFSLKMQCVGVDSVKNVQFVFGINSFRQERITTLCSTKRFDINSGEIIEGEVYIPSVYLTPGWYSLTLGIRQPHSGLDHLEFINPFEVLAVMDAEEHINRELISYGLIQIVDAEWKVSSEGEVKS